MKSVQLGPSKLAVTQLGYGCAQLMRLPLRRDRRRILDCAFDLGIRHFDVARMYGLGQAESELGRFAADKRDRMTIFTKFGLSPPPYAAWLARLQAIPRWVMRRFPQVRNKAIAKSGGTPPSGDFSACAAEASLAASLQQLQTDYIDALVLHEPPGDAQLTDELLHWLEQQQQRGRIREFGVSGEFDDVRQLCERYPSLRRIVQFSHSVGDPPERFDAFGNSAGLVTFGAVRRMMARLGDGGTNSAMATGSEHDLRNESLLACEAVKAAVAMNDDGAVLIASTRATNLRNLVKAVEDNLPPPDWFRQLVESFHTTAPTSGPTDD